MILQVKQMPLAPEGSWPYGHSSLTAPSETSAWSSNTKRSGLGNRFPWRLAIAGLLLCTSGVLAEEAVVEGVSMFNVNVRGLNEKGVIGIVSYLVNQKETVVDLLGKDLPHQELQKGWKVDITWKRPPGSGKDSTARLATQITVQCEWLDGTLNTKPTEQGAVVQTMVDDKPVLMNVRFTANMDATNLGDRKPRDLARGAAVKMQVISGSQPPIVLALQSTDLPTPEPTPALGPPTSPAATQPASQSSANNITGKIEVLEGNKVTLHIYRGTSGLLTTIPLTDHTIVILDGKPAKLTELKIGQWVKITRDETSGKALKIEPAAAPWDEYLVPQPTTGPSKG